VFLFVGSLHGSCFFLKRGITSEADKYFLQTKLPDSSTYYVECSFLYMEFRVVSKQLFNDVLKHMEERGRCYEYECGGKDR
jgi:hypothetical protein